MFIGKYALPELLDIVFEYLDQETLTASTFVNRQFSTAAYSLLYRAIELNDQPQKAHKPE
jgi:hypothetical protein